MAESAVQLAEAVLKGLLRRRVEFGAWAAEVVLEGERDEAPLAGGEWERHQV